jgi:hydrogenase maturation protease
MSDRRVEVLALGIGNVLWADEGFGVRAVEALHAGWVFPDGVRLLDGGTLGLELFDEIASARRLLVFDAIDRGVAPGTLVVLEGSDVPAWSGRRLSPHQNGLHDVLALAALRGSAPEAVTAIGVQPVTLEDFGGSLRPEVKARVPEAVALAVEVIRRWGYAPTARDPAGAFEPLNAAALALDSYEGGRPSASDARRDGDPRVLALSGAARVR